MTLATVRRLAARILDVGENRVRFKDDQLGRAQEALTTEDVRGLVKEKAVYAIPVRGKRKKEKRTRRTAGDRQAKGSLHSKEEWMQRIRAQRKFLVLLLSQGCVDASLKRSLYMKVKSGIFKNKRAFTLYLKDAGQLKKEPVLPKWEAKAPKAAPTAKKPKVAKKGES